MTLLAIFLAGGVDLDDRVDDAHRAAIVVGGLGQRERVLREARAAIAGAGIQEFRADAAIEADAARDFLDVGADLFAEVRHLVDEGDLHGEEGVGGVLDQLRRAARGEQDRRLVEEERAVELAHHLLGALVLGADDDAVRDLEVLDGGAFAQEFGVGDDGEVAIRAHLLDDRLDFVARADRHRGLGYDDREAVHQLADLFGRGIDVGKVCVAVAPPRGRAHGDEHRIGILHRFGGVSGKEQALFLDVAGDEGLEAGLVDRHDAGLELVDLRLVLVHAGDDVAEIGKTGARHEADIARSDNRDTHGIVPQKDTIAGCSPAGCNFCARGSRGVCPKGNRVDSGRC
jgi:hypothetical protein